MTDLSLAAQAVLDAFANVSNGEYVECVWVVNERTMLAAALRVAADQVVPTTVDPRLSTVRSDLMRIAAELEAFGNV
jgi:hypothetical protein